MMKEPQSHPSFPDMEEKRLHWWDEQNIPGQYLQKNATSEKRFSFLDGPITANNPMGVHHAHGRTIKDFFQRYKNMRGFKQRFQNGFDCQGLWVEVEEEKSLGFNSKRDIEAHGIEKFCVSCRTRVEKFSKVQTEQSKRLGMFMDWENSYYTMSEKNNVHIWHFLKKVNDKGWLFKGIDAMPWCTRCGTAISQHELSDDGGYKEVTHESVYVRLIINDAGKERLLVKLSLPEKETMSFLVWTTTPWTLLANTAVAINPELTYIIVKQNQELLILAKERLSVVNDQGPYQVLAEVKGNEILEVLQSSEGKVYKHPFESMPAVEKQARQMVVAWEEVSDQEGTGFVHIAPSAGEEDFDLGKQNSLGFDRPSIDEFGVYVDGFGAFTGKSVFDVREEIFEDLKKQGLLYKTEPITHSYPHCWRCKHELVFRTTEEWFIRADEIRPLMKEAAEKVNWIPAFAEKRMQDWLDNMGDWPISRKRYWGLALPFYVSDDGEEYYVVESREELRKLATEPEKVDALPELHRPWIDEIKITSPVSGKVLTRVKDVGDCWLDAGIVPFSTVDYLTDKENWHDWYPFEFITEYVAQVKLWFYATLFMSVTLEGKAPWKNVLATGFLVDEKGDAMHKSRGNAIPFDEAAEKAGADMIRWLYLRERVANHHGTGNLRFGYTVLDEVRRRFFVILWNTYRFFVQNALMDGWKPENYSSTKSNDVLDQWILSRLYHVLRDAEETIETFDSTQAASAIESFVVSDFSQWYIRRSRDRVGPSATDQESKTNFYQTTYHILTTLIKLMAPFTPFLADEIYQNLRLDTDPVSIHLTEWPERHDELINLELETQMELVRENAEKAHSLRKSQGIPVRQPLGKLATTSYSRLNEQTRELLADETNVHTIEPMPLETDELQVELDFIITDELRREGLVRELTRAIQNMRKEAGYALNEKIHLTLETESTSLKSALEQYQESIKQAVLAERIESITPGQELNGDVIQEITLDGEHLSLAVKKV